MRKQQKTNRSFRSPNKLLSQLLIKSD